MNEPSVFELLRFDYIYILTVLMMNSILFEYAKYRNGFNYCMVTDDDDGDDMVTKGITTPDYNSNVNADDDVDYDKDRYDDDDDLILNNASLPSVCNLHALIIYLLLQHFVQLSLVS